MGRICNCGTPYYDLIMVREQLYYYIFVTIVDKHCFCCRFCSEMCLLNCSPTHKPCLVLLTSLTYHVHDSPSHLYMPQLFTHYLSTIICIICEWLLSIWFNIYASVICCSVEMPWGYFVHVCYGPLSFAIFDFGVYCLLFQYYVLHQMFCAMSLIFCLLDVVYMLSYFCFCSFVFSGHFVL